MPFPTLERNRVESGGKLKRREYNCGRLSANADYHCSSIAMPRRRLFVSCKQNKRQFLVDTGSDITIFSVPPCRHRPELPNIKLQAANGTKIPVYSHKKLTFDF